MGTELNRISWKLLVILTVAVGLTIVGCGGSQEATEGESSDQGQSLGQDQQKPPQEQPKNADDQALTSFIGAKEPAKTQTEEQKPTEQPVASTGQLARYEKQIETLRTENTTLKQKVLKLEQDNRSLNSMMSESESRIAAANARTDSLGKLLVAQPVVAAQPAAPAQEAAQAPVENASITSYEDALKAFNAKKYDDAIAGLKGMLQAGVSKDLEDNCKYWIGESNFAKKRYKEAIKDFEDVLSYKNSEKKGDAQYMVAQCYERMGDKVKAKAGYEKVVKEFPLSKVVKKAKERWAKL